MQLHHQFRVKKKRLCFIQEEKKSSNNFGGLGNIT